MSRKLVDVDYCVGLGQSAYGQLARTLGGGSRSAADIYTELAARFPEFVDVLMEVRKRVDFATPDVMRLYESWLRTRDEWVEKKLRAAGVIIAPEFRVIQ